MIELSGKDIDIVFTGLRQGEKLHEDLIGEGEDDSRPLHPKISHARIDPLDPADMSLAEWKDRQHLPEAAETGTLSLPEAPTRILPQTPRSKVLP
jgi:FlaA1/EpsC-like NDP-sugar epimerase